MSSKKPCLGFRCVQEKMPVKVSLRQRQKDRDVGWKTREGKREQKEKRDDGENVWKQW